eukprot:TRINITY_DN48897_c0_g1_i1.p1 TRINITY_DN48897_c0_g1~~TRINITY_DN48897_c0_g1_i1.p1  ORF type:complete len:294 (-),score=24.38 TRINITY_DN48897_c0_g1_i1:362-1243(-)
MNLMAGQWKLAQNQITFNQISGCFSVMSKRYISSASKEAPSVDPSELKKFREIASEWWSIHGPFGGLHIMNPSRCLFIRRCICAHFSLDFDSSVPFEGKTILDVGCGGGILSESLARMGAQVTGIDAEETNIKVAQSHAQNDQQLQSNLKYQHSTAEELQESGQQQFDVVVASEVIEHVKQPKQFFQTLYGLTKPGGGIVITTINRTIRSYLATIVAAEYILNIVPNQTHKWEKFLSPQELAMMSNEIGLEMSQVSGIWINPFRRRSSLIESTEVNYAAYFKKPVATSFSDAI